MKSKSETESLKRRLANKKKNLRLIRERKSEYVQRTNIPLELIDDERRLEKEIEALEAQLEAMRGEPSRLFICYKRNVDPDQRLAHYLHDFLTAQGHDVFIDQTMRTGEAWLEQIDQQIKTSDFLIALLSEASSDSEMVQAEIRRAYEYRKRQGYPHTLPVRIAYEGLLPYSIDAFLDPLQYVVWESDADDERVGSEILAPSKAVCQSENLSSLDVPLVNSSSPRTDAVSPTTRPCIRRCRSSTRASLMSWKRPVGRSSYATSSTSSATPTPVSGARL